MRMGSDGSKAMILEVDVRKTEGCSREERLRRDGGVYIDRRKRREENGFLEFVSTMH